MRTFGKFTFFISAFFAVIAYIVVLFFEKKLAIIAGILAFLLYYIVFDVIDIFYSKKAMKMMEGMEDALYRHIVNYCENKRVENGWLFLTKNEFVFLSLDKKKAQPVKIPICDVKSIKYEENSTGMKLVRTDDTSVAFVLTEQEFEKIKEIFIGIRYGN